MPVFTFHAKNFSGQSWDGSLEAESLEDLQSMLNEKGFFPTEIKEKQNDVSLGSLFERVNKRDLAIFCRQLSVLINSGITIVEAISILAEQTAKRSFREVLELIGDDVQKGKLLSQSMSAFPKVFPEFLLNMIQVGEASGTLDDITDQMANFYEKEDKLARKVTSSMVYPIILGVMTLGVIILLMVKVLPQFSNVLSQTGGEMPALTKVLMAVSHFMVSNFLWLSIGIGILIAVLVSYLRTPAGRLQFDAFKLKFFLSRSITIKIITSRFARSMGILLKSGMNIITAMTIMKNLIGNREVEKRFAVSAEEVQQGKGISESLERIGIFPPLLIHMVQVGERTGELDQMLLRTSGFFDDEVDAAITKMTTFVEPVMIIVMAVVVGIILLSIFLPMLSIMNTIA